MSVGLNTAACLRFSSKCHSAAVQKLKSNTQTCSHHYKCMALLCTLHACVAFRKCPQRRGIDKPTNSNWAIMTPCNGIDSTVLGAGG